MQVRAAIFDLDGVLADSSRTHFLAWRRLAIEEGIYFDEAINERMKGVSRLESLEILLENRIEHSQKGRKLTLQQERTATIKS